MCADIIISKILNLQYFTYYYSVLCLLFLQIWSYYLF